MLEKSKIQEVRQRLRTSPSVKLLVIGLIILILLIPSAMIKSIIHEREGLSRSAISEVSNKWARSQNIKGPILSIPYTKEHIVEDKRTITDHLFHILPEQLEIAGEVTPKSLRRGIYEVVVYGSGINLKGFFNIDEIDKLTGAHDILWAQSFVTMGISDLRGIKNQLHLGWEDQQLSVEPGSRIGAVIKSGVTISAPIDTSAATDPIDFELDLILNGSENLSFVPVGGVTSVKLTSPWTAPSFNGNILPDDREVTADGFIANWKTLELNRNYPQSWTDYEITTELESSKFGVDLLLPIDDYQKSLRSAKYAIMILALTFLVFFLVEVMTYRRIHPFQYTLVGLALCLFYILLVSISEHSNFDTAYLVSSVSIVLMISLYSLSLLSSKKLSLVLTFILSSLYGFLFVLLQLADYALLMGSIGLAVILACTMYFTRHIDWYQLGESKNMTTTE